MERRKFLTRADLLLILVLFAVCGGFFLCRKLSGPGMTVRISVENQVIRELPLNKDTAFTVTNDYGTNTVIIEAGTVYVTDADCPDKICEDMGKISKPGETIICLPHKLIIEVSDEP